MNHFEFFELPVALEVDLAALQQLYYRNSKKYHPDFHTLADTAEQERVLDLASQNNEAYKTLRDTDQRIQYVLKIKGLIGEEASQQPLPQSFLMEMMDINEALMDLEFDYDANRYETAHRDVQALEIKLTDDIRPILDTWTETTGTTDDLLRVREYFLKKKYLLRILENLSKFAPAN